MRLALQLAVAVAAAFAVAACGGGGGGSAGPPPAPAPDPDGGATVVAPAFTTSPGDAHVTAGQAASFSVAVTGTPAPALQWQRSIDGTTYVDVTGATTTTYAFVTAAGDDGLRVRARATNSAGTVTSAAALLQVDPVTVAISVHIDAPADGSRIVGVPQTVLSSYQVQGTVDPGAAVSVSVNGGAWTVAAVTGSSFTATVALSTGANTIRARAASGTATALTTASVTYPFLAVSDFMAAKQVIGQGSFTEYRQNCAQGAAVLNGCLWAPWGHVAWDGTWLYVQDTGNARILGYHGLDLVAGHWNDAAIVLGQPSFTEHSWTGTGKADSFFRLYGVAAGDGKLFAANYNRVSVFDPAPEISSIAASYALGAASLTDPAVAVTTHEDPRGVSVGGGRLAVADTGHHRVLLWNAVPTTDDAPPDVILGHADAVSVVPWDDLLGHATTASPHNMSAPYDVWTDGTRVLVADANSGRVLVWNAWPTVNGQAADLVLGVPDFYASPTGIIGPSTFYTPLSVGSNGNQIFVTDDWWNRVLVWTSWPTSNGQAANVVIGQSSWTRWQPNDSDQNGVADSFPGARTFNMPNGVTVGDTMFFVTDRNNNRVLVFVP